MRINFLLLWLPFLLIAKDNIEKFENIEVEGSQYIQKQDFLQNAPMQKQITTKEALDIPGTNGDPIKAIKTFAGVTSTDNDSAEMIIHGSKPRETRFTINKLPLGYVFHLGGLHSVISPEATKQLDAYLGAFDVSYYGMGAIIDITPEYPTGDNKGRVHIGMYDSDIAYDGAINDNISIFISARRSYFDLFAAKIMKYLDDDETLSFTLFPQFYDTNIMINANYGDHQFILENIISQDDLKLNIDKEDIKDPVAKGKIEVSQGFITTGTRWIYYSDSFTSNTLLYKLKTKNQTNLFDNDYYIKESIDENGFNHTTVFDSDFHKTTLGVHYIGTIAPVEGKIMKRPTADSPDGNNMTSATIIELNEIYYADIFVGYAQDIWSLNNSLRVRYGIRAWDTKFQKFGFNYNPRGAVVYDINDTYSISFALGKYSQLPRVTYVIDQFGNTDIDTYENSNHYALNFKAKFTDSSNIVIEPYYKSFDTLLINSQKKLYEAIGEGEAYGIDITYTKNIGNTNIIGAYTYVKASRELYADDSKWYRFYGEIPHTFQLSSSYKFNNGFKISSLFKYSDGKPYTPLKKGDDGKYYTSVTLPVDGKLVTYNSANLGKAWSARLPSSYDLDIKIAYIKKMANGHQQEWALEILNLTTLWHKNISDIKYNDEYEEDGYYYQMGLIPAFHYTYKF